MWCTEVMLWSDVVKWCCEDMLLSDVGKTSFEDMLWSEALFWRHVVKTCEEKNDKSQINRKIIAFVNTILDLFTCRGNQLSPNEIRGLTRSNNCTPDHKVSPPILTSRYWPLRTGEVMWPLGCDVHTISSFPEVGHQLRPFCLVNKKDSLW